MLAIPHTRNGVAHATACFVLDNNLPRSCSGQYRTYDFLINPKETRHGNQ